MMITFKTASIFLITVFLIIFAADILLIDNEKRTVLKMSHVRDIQHAYIKISNNESKVIEPSVHETVVPNNVGVIETPINKGVVDPPVNKDVVEIPIDKSIIDTPINKSIIDTPINKSIIDIPINKSVVEPTVITQPPVLIKQAPACPIPKLNPFSKDVLKYYDKIKKRPCTYKKIGIIKDGTLIVKDISGAISMVAISYVIRGRKRTKDGSLDHSYQSHSSYFMDRNMKYSGAANDDSHVHFTDQIELTKNNEGVYSHLLTNDFVRVKITKRGSTSTEYHAHIANKNVTCSKYGKRLKDRKKGLPFNVALVMMDAQSHANIQRHFPNFIKMVENDPNTITMEGLSLNGMGTVAQVLATLTGSRFGQDMLCSKTTRKTRKKESCDGLDLIFRDFNNAGYTTMFNEDHTNGGAFEYRLNGFEKPQTDWYMRPYWIAEHESRNNCGRVPCVCEAEEALNILKTFTNTCADEAKFSFTSLNIAHDSMNLIQLIEPQIIDIVKYFQEKSLQENTIFVLFGDHGARIGAKDSFRSTIQGKIEEFLPFYMITLPPVFRTKYKELYDNLKENSEILTSHLDMHVTLKHLLSYPDLPENNKKYGQSLFTKMNATSRTCAIAGVPEIYCPCLDLKPIHKDNLNVRRVLTAVIDHMNQKLNEKNEVKGLCATLTLQYVFHAGLKESRNGGRLIDTLYEVSFKVSPSNGTFEAHAKITQNNEILVNPSISRTNIYGLENSCIQVQHPKIAPYCICHDYLKKL